eukprot:gene24945-30139_t
MSSKIQAAYDTVKKGFSEGLTRPYEFRKAQLEGVKKFLVEKEKDLAEALASDLHRSDFEGIALEIASAAAEVDMMLGSLHKWMQPIETPVPALFAPATSYITHEPYGVALVIGAFNYPVVLTLSPMIGAIAAGNAVIIKPSEMSRATETLLHTQINNYCDPRVVQCVVGDYKVSEELLRLRWDKIFFTGSTRVGKIVLKAAAEHLTPVSLELGGKSPTIVDKSVYDLDLAVKRIVWGKGVNAGQTCIAPDYVYVHKSLHKQFLERTRFFLQQFYGANARDSKDFARIISDAHYERLRKHIVANKHGVVVGGDGIVDGADGGDADDADAVAKRTRGKGKGGKLSAEGSAGAAGDRYIPFTVFSDIDANTSTLMQEELFGPLLPVFVYEDIQEVIDYVNQGEKPLTLYIFARNQNLINKITTEISSGSVLVNDTLFTFANLHAPFGGVGHSGMGGYRGKYSFECFSHKRPVLIRNDLPIMDIPIRYPPYTPFGLNLFKTAAKLPDIPPLGCLARGVAAKLIWVLVGVGAAYVAFKYGGVKL